MSALDPAAEAYIARLLDQAPPPPAEAVALFARSLDQKTTDAPASDAA